MCPNVGADIRDDSLAVTKCYCRSAVAANSDGVHRVVDFGRRAVSVLLVARAVPGGPVLGVGAVRSEIGQVERLACEVGEGEINSEAVLGRV